MSFLRQLCSPAVSRLGMLRARRMAFPAKAPEETGVATKTTKVQQFSTQLVRKGADGKEVAGFYGRAWKATELSLKSNEELHKLWYVLLKEKNALKSDYFLREKLENKKPPQNRLVKVKKSMARLLTILAQRKKVREEYKKQLEDEYVEKQRQAEQARLLEQQRNTVEVPLITQELLRMKYSDLKKGRDNLNYITEMIEYEKNKKQHRQHLKSKYDYAAKAVVAADQPLPEGKSEDDVLRSFKSFVDKQLETGDYKVSSEEVLRAHIKNWKMLSLRQRRIMLSLINARRAREAKSEFLNELSLLGQKLAHDDLQRQAALK